MGLELVTGDLDLGIRIWDLELQIRTWDWALGLEIGFDESVKEKLSQH